RVEYQVSLFEPVAHTEDDDSTKAMLVADLQFPNLRTLLVLPRRAIRKPATTTTKGINTSGNAHSGSIVCRCVTLPTFIRPAAGFFRLLHGGEFAALFGGPAGLVDLAAAADSQAVRGHV